MSVKEADKDTQPDPDLEAAETAASDTDDDEQALWNELAKLDSADPAKDADSDGDDVTDDVTSEGDDGGEEKPADDAGAANVDLEEQVKRLQTEIAERDKLLESKDRALSSERGRTSALTKKADSLQRQLAELREQRKQMTEGMEPKTRENLDKARREYSDVVGPVADALDAVDKRVSAAAKLTDAQISQTEGALREIYETETAVFMQEHKDGIEVIQKNRDTFNSWIEDQPKAVRDTYEANKARITDGRAAALVVAQFKSFLRSQEAAPNPQQSNPLRTVRERQIAGAASTRGSSVRPSTDGAGSASEDDPEAIWAELRRQEQEAERRSNRR